MGGSSRSERWPPPQGLGASGTRPGRSAWARRAPERMRWTLVWWFRRRGRSPTSPVLSVIGGLLIHPLWRRGWVGCLFRDEASPKRGMDAAFSCRSPHTSQPGFRPCVPVASSPVAFCPIVCSHAHPRPQRPAPRAPRRPRRPPTRWTAPRRPRHSWLRCRRDEASGSRRRGAGGRYWTRRTEPPVGTAHLSGCTRAPGGWQPRVIRSSPRRDDRGAAERQRRVASCLTAAARHRHVRSPSRRGAHRGRSVPGVHVLDGVSSLRRATGRGDAGLSGPTGRLPAHSPPPRPSAPPSPRHRSFPPGRRAFSAPGGGPLGHTGPRHCGCHPSRPFPRLG
jgi:hypothetical protein